MVYGQAIYFTGVYNFIDDIYMKEGLPILKYGTLIFNVVGNLIF